MNGATTVGINNNNNNARAKCYDKKHACSQAVCDLQVRLWCRVQCRAQRRVQRRVRGHTTKGGNCKISVYTALALRL